MPLWREVSSPVQSVSDVKRLDGDNQKSMSGLAAGTVALDGWGRINMSTRSFGDWTCNDELHEVIFLHKGEIGYKFDYHDFFDDDDLSRLYNIAQYSEILTYPDFTDFEKVVRHVRNYFLMQGLNKNLY